MLSLIQIQDRFTTWFDNHALINTVMWADDFKLEAEDGAVLYPVANMNDTGYSLDGKFLRYTFSVYLLDLYSPDIPNHATSIVSDMLRVADDFIAYLENDFDWTLNQTTQIRKTVDEMGNRVAGIKFTITLSIFRDGDVCATPTKN